MSDTTGLTGSGGSSKSSKGHCKRFWWVYLIVLAVIVVIVVPVIILVAVPKIAQQKVDGAKLHLDGISISQTQANSLVMSINSTITTDGSAKAVIAPFTGSMWLLDADPPFVFAQVAFPETSSDPLVLVNISQTISVSSNPELTVFNQYLLSRDKVNVRVEGDTTLRVSGIAKDYPVTFSKDVEIVGFNSFAGIQVTNAHVSLGTTNNFNATVTIPNPTIWTIDVGNATFNTFFNNTSIGITNITNMVLSPGNNTFFTAGDTDQAVILEALQEQPYCSNGGVFGVTLSGRSVVNKGQSIPWLSDALAASNQSVTLNIGQAVKNDLGLTVPCAATTTTSNSTAKTNSTTSGHRKRRHLWFMADY